MAKETTEADRNSRLIVILLATAVLAVGLMMIRASWFGDGGSSGDEYFMNIPPSTATQP